MHRHRVGVRAVRVLAASLIVTVGLSLATPGSVDAATAVDMLALQNQMRFAIGAPTLAADPRVVLAAQNHANYNAANHTGGHFETAGLPYYTGYAPRDRVIAAGLTTAFVSEVATGGADALGGTRVPIYYAAQQFEYDYQVIIPQRPLVANTTYHVRFDINVSSVMVTNEWDFSTGSTISAGGPTSAVPTDNGLHSAWVSQ